jgi:hypothetical protein
MLLSQQSSSLCIDIESTPAVMIERHRGKCYTDVTNNEMGGLKCHGERTDFYFGFTSRKEQNNYIHNLYTLYFSPNIAGANK